MRAFFLSILFCLSLPAYAQNLSFGLLAGTAITDDFRSLPPIDFGFPAELTSGHRTLLGGPSIEWHFRDNWSLEGDAIFRELETGANFGPLRVVTWEFPVLLKYTFATNRRVRPFLDGGPSFRTAGNLNGTEPRHEGIAAGAGLDIRAAGWSIQPQLRYTHWRADGTRPFEGNTLPNQLEFLLGFSRTSVSGVHPLGGKFAVGAVFGTNLNSLFPSMTYQAVSITFNPDGSTTETPFTVRNHQEHSLIAGAMAEAFLPRNFSIEGDALYAPPHIAFSVSDSNGSSSGVSATSLWEFPVLAKYRFHEFQMVKSRWQPFVGLGPSFRLDTQLHFEGHVGITAGAGLETRWRAMRIAPTVRYTHWHHGTGAEVSLVNHDLVEFLTGFSF